MDYLAKSILDYKLTTLHEHFWRPQPDQSTYFYYYTLPSVHDLFGWLVFVILNNVISIGYLIQSVLNMSPSQVVCGLVCGPLWIRGS